MKALVVKVHVEKMKARVLEVGDLFSTAGPDYWAKALPGTLDGPVGERLFVRTKGIPDPDDDDADVYRITINKGDAR